MSRVSKLIVVVALVFGLAGIASALDVKVISVEAKQKPEPVPQP